VIKVIEERSVRYTIYQLIDPRDGLPRYVGYTRGTLETRLKEHCNDNISNLAKAAWIQELKAHGILPTIQELENASSENEALDRERAWIHCLLNQNMPLLNISSTSNGQLKKLSFYLTEKQEEKLDNLEIEFYLRHKRKVNRNEIVRLLIDQCDIDSLADLVRLAEQRARNSM
jgi:hypothetical protein